MDEVCVKGERLHRATRGPKHSISNVLLSVTTAI